MQNALYGRSDDALNILCEDAAAEGILMGVFDVLNPKLGFRTDSVRIGRDTGADEFPTHARSFRKFGQIQNFIFVLDGDKRDSNIVDRIQSGPRADTSILFLPGRSSPEVWTWETLDRNAENGASELNIDQRELAGRITQANAVFNTASDSPSQIAKSKLRSLAEGIRREFPDICRVVARLEANRTDSDIQPLVEQLEDALLSWRGR